MKRGINTMRMKELIVYRNLKKNKLLTDMSWLMEHFDDDYYNLEDRVYPYDFG